MGVSKIVWLLHQDYNSKWCQFSIDSEADLKLLPKFNVAGKGILNPVSSCCPNSRAICTDGTVYILNGDINEWIKYSSAGTGSGSGSSGGDIIEIPTDWDFATDEDIDNLFK